MTGSLTRKIVVAAVVVLAVTGAGAAVAATRDSPEAESQAVLNDVANELGVQPSEVTAALKKALSNRVDEAVEDGRLTQAEGNAIKARINSGNFPLFGLPKQHFGFGPGFGFRHHGPMHELSEVAEYLGITQDQLRTQLNQGKTLAQIARDRDKSVDGLVDVIVKDKTARINEAVEDGRLTRAQADEMIADLREHVTDFVNNGKLHFRFRDKPGGPDFEKRFGGGPGGVLPVEPGLEVAPAFS
jgi:AraC-like DNA-binding protein